jgi:tetratricopeptide (TPR) repeat protein
MLEILLIIGASVFLYQQISQLRAKSSSTSLAPKKVSQQLIQMVEYADRLYQERKWLAAEKAYLKVLALDHKNITAYSHLGVIYSAQKNMADAVECFEIAVRLKPSAPTLQNLGLAYLENKNYMKAIVAFEKSIAMEPNAQRYIGLSKAHKKLHAPAKVVVALERAVELDGNKKVLQLLADAYDEAGQTNDATRIYRRIHELDPNDTEAARWIGIHLPKTRVKT